MEIVVLRRAENATFQFTWIRCEFKRSQLQTLFMETWPEFHIFRWYYFSSIFLLFHSRWNRTRLKSEQDKWHWIYFILFSQWNFDWDLLFPCDLNHASNTFNWFIVTRIHSIPRDISNAPINSKSDNRLPCLFFVPNENKCDFDRPFEGIRCAARI